MLGLYWGALGFISSLRDYSVCNFIYDIKSRAKILIPGSFYPIIT